MNINEFARQVVEKKGDELGVGITQCKEIIVLTLRELGNDNKETIYELIKRYNKGRKIRWINGVKSY